jgi:hypothetical protein
MIHILDGERGNLNVILIFIFLMANVEHYFHVFIDYLYIFGEHLVFDNPTTLYQKGKISILVN